MNKYDNEVSREMLRICDKFQIAKLKTYLAEFPFEDDEYISPFIIDKIEVELEFIISARSMLDELMNGNYKKIRGDPYTEASQYFIVGLANINESFMTELLKGSQYSRQNFSTLKQALAHIRNYLWKWIFVVAIIYNLDLGIENPLRKN